MSGQPSRRPGSQSLNSSTVPHESYVHSQVEQWNTYPVTSSPQVGAFESRPASFVHPRVLPTNTYPQAPPSNAYLFPSSQPMMFQHPFPAPAVQSIRQALVPNIYPLSPLSNAYPQSFVSDFPQSSVSQSRSSQAPLSHLLPQASSSNAHPQSSVSPAPPQFLTSPQPWEITTSEAIELGRAWVQPLNGLDIQLPRRTCLVAQLDSSSLFGDVREGLFGRSKGFLDRNRPIVLIEGQSYELTCFCRSSDVDYEPKDEVDCVMFSWRSLPQSHSPYICYACKSCECKWAMNMPSARKDLKSLQKALRSTKTWEALDTKFPTSIGPVYIATHRDHHNFTCPLEIKGCGKRNIAYDFLCHKDDKGKQTSFIHYTCKDCGYHWSAREPVTHDEWSRWTQRRNESNITIGSRPAEHGA